MKFYPPFGSADPNAGYVDRNTPGAISGSRVPAKAIEHPMREILAVILAAGLSPSEADLTQLLQAIDQRIAAATGGEPDENYVLMPQARARLPIYPEVTTADGKIPCLSPSAGTVRVPAGYSFVHRGIFAVTTVETDFATAANKTYHLRWSPDDGWALKDLADSGYNPGAAAETSNIFDTTYDDALFSKVVTNGANVVTVTNLVNGDRLFLSVRSEGNATAVINGTQRFSATQTYNWARAPKMKSVVGNVSGDAQPAGSMDHIANRTLVTALDRYACSAQADTDWVTGATFGTLQGYLDFNFSA